MTDKIPEEFPDKEDIKTKSDEVRRWQSEITLALETEKKWRQEGERILKVYRSESDNKVRKDTFNILWANTEIKRQSVINTTPIPDCRRRYSDDDPVGKEVSEILNRAVSYTLDCQDALNKLIAAANDFLLPGRGEIRVRYKGYMEPVETEVEIEETADGPEAEEAVEAQEQIGYEECQLEHVQWNEFIHGPAKEWDPVPWIGFIHDLTKDDAEDRFGEKAQNLSYSMTTANRKDGKKLASNNDNSDVTIFQRTTVYEIWDKSSKKILWIGKDYADDFLDEIDDPMELQNFFCVPRPMYAIEDPNSLIPIPEYSQYETLAKELEDITRRLLKLVKACKVRGVYDSRLSEIERVLDEDENALIPAENSAAINEIGGLAKAFWFLPLEQIVGVIQTLNNQRISVKQQIDELNGMSDIVRGSTNPNETATAQRIKANFASARLDKQKQSFQRFARDLVRLIADVISKFKRENLTAITGLSYLTNAEKMQRQQEIQALSNPQMVQASGMQPEQVQQRIQQLQQEAAKPSWEDIEAILRSDILREYHIDIETDSTMAADQQSEQEVLASFMQAMAQFSTMASGAMQTGLMTGEAAKKIMIAFTRKFRLGKDVEEELEKPLPPKGPDPEMAKMQAEMQMAQQEFAMKQQVEQQKMQMDQQTKQAELEIERQKQMLELQAMQAEYAHKQRMYELEFQSKQQQLALQQQSMAMKNEFAVEDHTRKIMEKQETQSVAQ
jgi:hypothetical protein